MIPLIPNIGILRHLHTPIIYFVRKKKITTEDAELQRKAFPHKHQIIALSFGREPRSKFSSVRVFGKLLNGWS